MIVPVHVPQPSERAKDLGLKMADLIRIYKQERPDLTMIEVRQAMQVAQAELRSDFPGLGSIAVIIGVLVAVMLAGIIAFLFMAKSGGGSGMEGLPIIMIVAVGIMTVGILAVFMAKRIRQ